MTEAKNMIMGSLPKIIIAAKEMIAQTGGNARVTRQAMIDTLAEYIY